jgi:DNA-binding LacI/PurR family transcriptional regulator
MAGIKAVAQKAGVSISTVSYALNGSKKVSEETRTRIEKIAKEMGYTPKLAARTLKGTKTHIVGVYISGFMGEFYGELLDGMQHKLRELGYDMMVSSGGRTHKFLEEKLFDGALIMDSGLSDKKLYQAFEKGNKMVLLDRKMTHENARTVLLDNELGARQAVEYLLQKKLDKYYVISGPEGNYDVKMRMESVRRTFEESGIDYHILDGDFTEVSGKEAAEYILSQPDKSKKTGIFALNDDEAVGFYRYMRTKKIDFSQKYFLVGFDNNHSSDFLNPVLPSVSYHKHTWGEVAAQTLVDLIEENGKANNQIVKTELSFRE